MDYILLYVITLIPFLNVLVNFVFPKHVDLFIALAQFLVCLLLGVLNCKKLKSIRDILNIKHILFFLLTVLMVAKSIFVRHYDNLTKWNAMSILVLIFLLLHYSDKEERQKLYEFILNKQTLVNIAICVYFAIILITMVDKRGFQYIWGSITLIGPYTLQHYLAYDLLTIIIIAEFLRIRTRRIWYGIYTIISIVLILLSGVRTVLLPLAFIIIFEFNLIKSVKIKLTTAMAIIASSIIIFVSGLYKSIPVLVKFKNTFIGGSISNGRNVFWEKDTEEFFHLGMGQKIFGAGARWLNNLNKTIINQSIHAHNDYINVMIMFGIIALILFITLNILCINWRNKYFFILTIFSLAFFNGLFTYSVFVISMPTMIIFFDFVKDYNETEASHE